MPQKFENRLTNKDFTPKNDLDHVFCMYKGVNPKVFKSNSSKFGDFVQAFGPQLSMFNYLVFWFPAIVLFYLHFHIGKSPSQDYCWY